MQRYYSRAFHNKPVTDKFNLPFDIYNELHKGVALTFVEHAMLTLKNQNVDSKKSNSYQI